MASRAMNAFRTCVPRLSTTVPRASFALSSRTVQPRFVEQQQQRFYAASASLGQDQIKARVLDVLQSFEKVDPSKLTPTASFTNDLGLDSLDAVEVVMAIEEEFSIEIPDEEADRITTVGEAIDYISKSPEAH